MTFIPAVIAWAFTLTFLIALVLVLLDVAGFRRIADEGQRKWLFRSLFGSVILAVVGFGTWQFDALKHAVDGPEIAAVPERADRGEGGARSGNTSSIGNETSSIGNESVSHGRAAGRATDPPAEHNAVPGAEQPNPRVAAWALQNLGRRPTIGPAFAANYPTCVARLRQREITQIEPFEASNCRRELSDYQVTQIVGFYNLKESYDVALLRQESLLRRGGVSDEERDFYNYVVREIEDLNDPGGPTLQRKDEAEARVLGDIRSCRQNRCHER